jgi:hypothetical protein
MQTIGKGTLGVISDSARALGLCVDRFNYCREEKGKKKRKRNKE